MTIPEKPDNRTEQYLNRLATGEGEIPEYPITRYESYLDMLCKNGGGNGYTKAQIDSMLAEKGEKIDVEANTAAIQAKADKTPATSENDGLLSAADKQAYDAAVSRSNENKTALNSMSYIIKQTHSGNITTSGWYRLFECYDSMAGNYLILINRGWGAITPEHILLSVCYYLEGASNPEANNCSILNINSANIPYTSLFTKARLVKSGGKTYFEVYYNSNTANSIQFTVIATEKPIVFPNPTVSTATNSDYFLPSKEGVSITRSIANRLIALENSN